MIDLEGVDGELELEAEVCVVGAGAAGISLTRRLLRMGVSVVLLESGGMDYEPATAALNDGASVGADYYDLEDTRLRFFGGTTAIWGGRCAELDAIDLERRDFVAHSGWPIDWAELQRWYAEARPLFGLGEHRPSLDELRAAGVPLPRFAPEQLTMPIWTFDCQFNRFALESCRDLDADPNCSIVLHATATEIVAAADQRSVERVEARSINGGRLKVRARHVVLAAGGIENPRLLLASRSVVPMGLGNGTDQVGRYFMEHPHARGGKIIKGAEWSLLKAFGRRHRVGPEEFAALITPSEDVQRREGILNTSVTIVGRQPRGRRQFVGMQVYSGLKHKVAPTRRGRALWMLTKQAATWAQQRIDPARPWLLSKLGRLEVALFVRGEQAPNPASRVMLSRDTDATGVPKVVLDWRLSEIDVRSVSVLVSVLGKELERLGLGHVEPADWLGTGEWRTDPLISAHPIAGYHHMGTTRMGTDPRTSVTDADGRVHGIGNLWIAGSSLFPTSSWANPTLTIVALTLRSAERIARELKR